MAAAVLVFAGCGDDDDDAGGSGDIDGYAYTATDVEGQSLADGSTLVVTFADGNVSAAGGCNTMFGAYELDGDTLVAGPLAQTQMACDEALMTQDTWVGELLQGQPTVTLDGDVLTIAGDDVTVTFGERSAAEEVATTT